MTETASKGGLMAGRRGLIMGVANERSIAWSVASALAREGAQLAFTYQNDAMSKRVNPLAASVGSDFTLECDVANDADLDLVFAKIKQTWGHLDFVVHAIAYSDKNELKGRYADTTRQNFSRDNGHILFFFHKCCSQGDGSYGNRRKFNNIKLFRIRKNNSKL